MKKLIILPFAFVLFAASMADDILFEDFEYDTGNPPPGWQTWEETPSFKYWEFHYDAVTGYGHNGSYGYAVRFQDMPVYTVDSWLVTATLDMTGYEHLDVSCYYCGFGAAYYTGSYIMGSDEVSPDANDFVELAELGPPPNFGSWEERIADASRFDGQSSVTFAIRYTGPGEYDILIDDILVTGDGGSSIESVSLGEIKAIYR